MKLKWMLAFFVATSALSTASASVSAVATLSCEQAAKFLENDSYTCDELGTDCSRGECVDTASCSYTKGFEGFTLSFAYPTRCGFDSN